MVCDDKIHKPEKKSKFIFIRITSKSCVPSCTIGILCHLVTVDPLVKRNKFKKSINLKITEKSFSFK